VIPSIILAAAEEGGSEEKNNFLVPNATFLFELVSFAIILFVLWKWILPPVNNAMTERQNKIKAQFEEAEKLKAEAEAAEAENQSQLAEARAEASRIREEAREQGAQIVAQHREQAVAEAERIPFEQARARLVLGSLDVEPREHLTGAYRAFDALGAGPWRRRAANALRTRGITVPRPAAREGGTLTDAEAQLVRLVRDGLTNKQIAAALHYSPRTVEVYLSRIYNKLNVSSRLELARVLDSTTLDA